MEKQLNGVMTTDKIRQSLDQIKSFINNELEEKKDTIKVQSREIDDLKRIITLKDQTIATLQINLKECRENSEGNRQLINKLLGDISKLQNDIDWYKRTFEKRSFLGTIKEKLFKKNR